MAVKTRRHGRKGATRHLNRHFSTQLRRIMAQQGVTRADLHKEAGFSRASVDEYVDGVTLPRIDVLAALAEHFKVSADFFLPAREGAA